VSVFADCFGRVRRARVWVALQFGLTLVLILAGLGWTRLPDKHWWQVMLTLLLPLLLTISLLELQAGTVRRLADDDGKRVKLVWGAVTLVVWVAVVWVTWAALDWCDDRIWQWASYLNSKASPNGRATVFTFEHIQSWLTGLEWVLRWVVVPAKVIPYAAATAQWGWRIPWRRIIRLLWNWRWWGGVALAALVAVVLPENFFAGAPRGTVTAQVWAVGLKLAVSYLLAMASWVVLLGWWAALFCRQQKPPAAEVMAPVPVLSGPPEGKFGAKAVPPEDESAG
jgi:hypothetical protein